MTPPEFLLQCVYFAGTAELLTLVFFPLFYVFSLDMFIFFHQSEALKGSEMSDISIFHSDTTQT